MSAGDGAGLDPALLERIEVLRGRPCTVEPLPGGLTNRNYKVTTPDGTYVLRHSNPSSADELAVDRRAEYENSVRAAAAGVGAPVVDFLPDDGVLVIGFLEGETLTDAHLQRPGILPRVAAACRRLHAGEPFVNRFDMFELQADYLGRVRRRGFRLPRGLPRPRRDRRRASGTPWRVRPVAPRPCNNDLLAANFIDDGRTVSIIDYEYSGNNDPYFELGNIWSECHLTLDQLEELVERLRRRPLPEPPGAGPPVGPHVPVRMDAVGVDPGRHQPDRVRLLELGDGEVRAGRGHLRRSRPRAAPGRRGAGRLRPDRARRTTVEHAPTGGDLPDRARVVVIGGGVIGTSTAYHLARLGWTDVLLLEQGQLSCGTTWHAAGLLGQLRATESGTRLVQYSARLYGELEAETGLATGLKRCGGVTVARTPERMVQLRRTAATAEAYDLECELLTPRQALERYPILETGDLLGALWLPGDATVNPVDVTASLARGARLRGVRIEEHTRVTGVTTRDGRVTGVVTDRGAVEAEVVVNCAGQWAKAVGLLCGVDVPLHSAEHFYVVTEAHRGRPPAPPHPARPRRVHVREGGGRRSRRRRLRADGQALGRPRRAAVPVRVPAPRGGLGPLQHPHGIGRPPDPRPRGTPG